MRFFLIIISFVLIAGQGFSVEKKTICLNMILKDESSVIIRCLESVKPLIDTWMIVDVGSTDGTQEIVREFMKDIPGELHERSWVSFGHNRNEALDLAKGKADYVLIIDAYESLLIEQNYKIPELDKDLYYIIEQFRGSHFLKSSLFKNSDDFKWEGEVVEWLYCARAFTSDILEGVVFDPSEIKH